MDFTAKTMNCLYVALLLSSFVCRLPFVDWLVYECMYLKGKPSTCSSKGILRSMFCLIPVSSLSKQVLTSAHIK